MQKLLETKKVARILEVAKKLPSNLHVESPRKGGRGDCSIKLCLESLRPEVQSLTLCIPFLTRGTPFVYLPLKNCTLFTYLLHENKSIRKVVFRSFSSNLQLNFHVNGIAIRRVSSKHFNKRCTCLSIAFSPESLWVVWLFSMCLGSRKIRLKSKLNTSCRVVPPYPKRQELLLECSKRKFHSLVHFF